MPKKRTLTQESIIIAAFHLLDEEGLANFNVRALAGKLSVGASALYRHFKNKDDILIKMTRTMFETWLTEFHRDGMKDWRDMLRTNARTLRNLLIEHRDGPQLFIQYHQYADSPLAEELLDELMKQGFSQRDATLGVSTLISFIIGFTAEEEPEKRFAYTESLRKQSTSSSPFLVEDETPDAEFNYGVELLLSALGSIKA